MPMARGKEICALQCRAFCTIYMWTAKKPPIKGPQIYELHSQGEAQVNLPWLYWRKVWLKDLENPAT